MNGFSRHNQVTWLLIAVGYLVMLITLFIPFYEDIPFLGHLKLGGLVTLIICPILGCIGLVLSRYAPQNQRLLLVICNLGLILSFPITWAIVSCIAGP